MKMTPEEQRELEALSPLDRIESPVLRERIRADRERLSSEDFRLMKEHQELQEDAFRRRRETSTPSG